MPLRRSTLKYSPSPSGSPDTATTTISDPMLGASVAWTRTSPPTSMVLSASAVPSEKRTKASALVLTALEPSTMLAAALPPAAVASLLVTASSVADIVACTVKSPPRSSVVSCTCAQAWAGISVPMLVPTKAPTVFRSKSCDCQPMLLKAKVTPTAVPPDAMVAEFSALMPEVFSASTLRPSPAAMVL